MKKLIIAAAVSALAMPIIAGLQGSAQAAPAPNPYCKMSQAANQSWAEYYGCWGSHARTQYAPAPTPVAYGGPDRTDYCKLSAAASASWAEHYGCWKAHR